MMVVGCGSIPIGLAARVAASEAKTRDSAEVEDARRREAEARRERDRWEPPPACTVALYWFCYYGGAEKCRDARAALAQAEDDRFAAEVAFAERWGDR